jgi:hypothetical protein
LEIALKYYEKFNNSEYAKSEPLSKDFSLQNMMEKYEEE